MKKKILFVVCLIGATLVSCHDREWGESETETPDWLGGSIYETLSNPNQKYLTGTFSNYLRLIDDLGYTETMSRTGSKTVFPANDEAFQRFFESDNQFGVHRYEDLTESMKKVLLYSSMLDNAYLVNMLSNVSSGSTSVERGLAIKHQTQLSVIDTITHITEAQIPANNIYWQGHPDIYYVSDNTRPMMVHFTKEQMLNNEITIDTSAVSDFAILTGSPYKEGAAYIFRNEIINRDMVCQNGYINQMQDVLVPPGNMAGVIREDKNMKLFSRMLDRFCAPYVDAVTTKAYNDWAVEYGYSTIDTIYQMRYLSSRSQGGANLLRPPFGTNFSSSELLSYDPGWNQYYPQPVTGSIDRSLADMGTMFVPDDEALAAYLLPGGEGEFLINSYATKPNTRENLEENIDCIPRNIVATFINNLMKASFVDCVPSKFSTIVNSATELMGVDIDHLQKRDGKYDVKIANNGVVYVLNKTIAPDEYSAVSAPLLFDDDLSVMRWAVIQDKTVFDGSTTTPSKLGLDFWAYLLAMSANFGFFIPDNSAFDKYIVDPVSLLDDMTPSGLHFYSISTNPFIACERVAYDKENHTFGSVIQENISIDNVATQFADILNTHTVVLKTGEKIGQNNYYRTKQGAAIRVMKADEARDSLVVGDYVVSGGQEDEDLEKSHVEYAWKEKNGRTYRIDHILQTPTQNIYSVLNGKTGKGLATDGRFSQFVDLCEGFEAAIATGLMEWAGYSGDVPEGMSKSPQESMKIFATEWQTWSSGRMKQVSYENNLTLLNSYHYTIYAPNNAAMAIAYNNGLAKWDDLNQMMEQYVEIGGQQEIQAKIQAKAAIEKIHAFVSYHLQSGYVFADNIVEEGKYRTLQQDDNNQFYMLTVTGGNGVLKVKDNAGVEHSISRNESDSKLVNKLAREYLFTYDSESDHTPRISTSSYAVIHELDEPLYINKDKKF